MLAEAMYCAAKTTFPDSMSGRTIGGLQKDWEYHLAAYVAYSRLGVTVLGIWNPERAYMGGALPGSTGYDNNAFVFEIIHAIDKIINPVTRVQEIVRLFR